LVSWAKVSCGWRRWISSWFVRVCATHSNSHCDYHQSWERRGAAPPGRTRKPWPRLLIRWESPIFRTNLLGESRCEKSFPFWCCWSFWVGWCLIHWRSITAAANVVVPSSAQAPAQVQGRFITGASTFGVASFIDGGDGDKQMV